MINLFNTCLLLAQTAQEKKLTVLYLGLFAMFVVLLVVDMYGQKKFAGGKVINKIILYFLALAIVTFIVAYLTMN